MATFKILLYKSKTLKDGSHPIVLQVIENSKPYKISLGYSATPEMWDEHKARYRKRSGQFKLKNEVLREKEVLAEKALDKIKLQNQPFTIELFKSLFLGKKKTMSLFEFFDKMIDDFRAKGRVGNMNVYRDTKNALLGFTKGNKSIMLADVNYKFIKRFETFLFARGCSGGGISVYMRTLRAAINEAIRQEIMDSDNYPFSTKFNKIGYSIAHLKSKASPRALSIEDMDKIKNFPVGEHPDLSQAHRYFLFSYYARGMNFKDMALLKWKNIYNGRINYTREKTGKFLTMQLTENLQAILDTFKDGEREYVFPILSDFHKTPDQIKNRIKKCLKKFNADLKSIANILDIDANVTSYVARHTYATTLKKKNANVALISEALGHTDLSTTKAYLKRFENSELDKLDELL